MFDSLLALLAPHYCIACGRLGSLWCDACRTRAPAPAVRCYRCHRLTAGGRTCQTCRRMSSLYAVTAVTRYDGDAKRLVWKVKFVRAQAGAGVMARLMAGRYRPANSLIVPVPTSTRRVRQRGYDQAVLLARHFARRTKVPYQAVLQRHGQKQQRTATRQQRLTQLTEAFNVPHPEHIAGADIILVDDVITTGATLEAAARALKTAGAKQVSAVVFAQA